MRWRRVLGWGCGTFAMVLLGTFVVLFRVNGIATSPANVSEPKLAPSAATVVRGATSTTTTLPPTAQPTAYCPLLEEVAPIAECMHLAELRARLAKGSAAFNAPATMQRGDTVRIRLAIDRTAGSTEPARLVDVLPGDTVAFETKVGRFMRAELSGEGFKVVALTDARQDFYADDRALWEWDATALRGGERVLTLRTYVETRGPDGRPRPLGGLRVEDRAVRVEVSVSERIADAVDAVAAWAGRGTNLLKALAVLVGAAGALWLAITGFGRKPKT